MGFVKKDYQSSSLQEHQFIVGSLKRPKSIKSKRAEMAPNKKYSLFLLAQFFLASNLLVSYTKFEKQCYSFIDKEKKKLNTSDWSSTDKSFYQIVRLREDALGKPVSKKIAIPRIIHQIWLGPKSLPPEHQAYRDSWKKHHPDWSYKLWRDADAAAFNFMNKKAYETATNYGEKSDILRYAILYEWGGIYADDDFECLASFDSLAATCTFFAGVEPSRSRFSISNAVIGCVPGNPLMKECLLGVHHKPNFKNSIREVLARSGPTYFTRTVVQAIKNGSCGDLRILPMEVLYPLPFACRFVPEKEKLNYTGLSCLAMHHWGGTWKNQ
jgi:mannosyltransferase OCH1-like enzyme